MIQNIYDDEAFFKGYANIRANPVNANRVMEQPCLWALLPDLNGKRVLDLGCGTGEACVEYIRRGAAGVTGIDVSKKMIKKAQSGNRHAGIRYETVAMEEFGFPESAFDCVVSSLALHYIEDAAALFRKISSTLTVNGIFVFSQEHPVITSTVHDQGWFRDGEGRKLHWKVDDYFSEGERSVRWIVDGVKKYHRTLQTVVDGLFDAGFTIERIKEPTVAADFVEKYPHFLDQRRMPLMLVVKARKR